MNHGLARSLRPTFVSLSPSAKFICCRHLCFSRRATPRRITSGCLRTTSNEQRAQPAQPALPFPRSEQILIEPMLTMFADILYLTHHLLGKLFYKQIIATASAPIPSLSSLLSYRLSPSPPVHSLQLSCFVYRTTIIVHFSVTPLMHKPCHVAAR